MKNFQLVGSGVNLSPILTTLLIRPELWDRNTLRTASKAVVDGELKESPHKQVSDIWLRFNKLPAQGDELKVVDDLESINYPAWFELPHAQQAVLTLMAQLKAERLGRVLITKLAPGATIAAHVDGGEHAKYYDRFHMVIQGERGSMFRCGDETVQMLSGQVWWFDNAVEHEIVNNSADDRIHLVVDLRMARTFEQSMSD